MASKIRSMRENINALITVIHTLNNNTESIKRELRRKREMSSSIEERFSKKEKTDRNSDNNITPPSK